MTSEATLDHLYRCLRITRSHHSLNNREIVIRGNGFKNYETMYFKEMALGYGWDQLSHRLV